MKKKRFTEEQITYALRQVEAGIIPSCECGFATSRQVALVLAINAFT
jgi:hypothetical protein